MKSLTVAALWIMMPFAFLEGFGARIVLAQQNPDAGQRLEKLPPDIRPDSLSRMPRPRRDDFAGDDEKLAFDRVLKLSPKQNASTGWLGPAGTRLQIPELAEIYLKQIDMLHDKDGLEPKYRELTILVSTREFNDEQEWLDHETRDVPKILSPQVVDIVRNNRDTKGLEEKEAVIIQFGRELFRQPTVSSKTFADMERNFGRKGTLSIALYMCYYASNGLLLHAYDQRIDSTSEKHPFPTLAVSAKPK